MFVVCCATEFNSKEGIILLTPKSHDPMALNS